MKSTCYLNVRGYELDSFGHVNNAVYLNYAETAKWDFFYNSGLWDRMKELHYFPVILENNIRYLHALHIMDKVRIDTEWKCSMGLITFTHTIFNETTGQKCCKVSGKLSLVDENEVICDIPEMIRQYMEKE